MVFKCCRRHFQIHFLELVPNFQIDNITTHLLSILSTLIGQSYMACLKHVTPKNGNANFRLDFRLEFVPRICY